MVEFTRRRSKPTKAPFVSQGDSVVCNLGVRLEANLKAIKRIIKSSFFPAFTPTLPFIFHTPPKKERR